MDSTITSDSSDPVASTFTDALSHLLQMRGLKQLTKAQAEYTEKSHLLQMRGLKLFVLSPSLDFGLVASFTDAWIETSGIES